MSPAEWDRLILVRAERLVNAHTSGKPSKVHDHAFDLLIKAVNGRARARVRS